MLAACFSIVDPIYTLSTRNKIGARSVYLLRGCEVRTVDELHFGGKEDFVLDRPIVDQLHPVDAMIKRLKISCIKLGFGK